MGSGVKAFADFQDCSFPLLSDPSLAEACARADEKALDLETKLQHKIEDMLGHFRTELDRNAKSTHSIASMLSVDGVAAIADRKDWPMLQETFLTPPRTGPSRTLSPRVDWDREWSADGKSCTANLGHSPAPLASIGSSRMNVVCSRRASTFQSCWTLAYAVMQTIATSLLMNLIRQRCVRIEDHWNRSCRGNYPRHGLAKLEQALN